MKSLSEISDVNFKELISHLQNELFSLYGLKAKIGAELEFYLIHQNEDEEQVLEKIASKCLRVDKERGWHQFESVLEYTSDLVGLGDEITEIKSHITVSARQHGIKAVFDAKPFDNDYGSGLHFHISLHNKLGINAFANGNYDDNETLQHSIGGILSVTEGSVFLLCSNDNDFKRFQEKDFLAPTHISWGGNNRSTIIRIPDSEPKFRRIEFRLPPANANPYVAICILLFGVLEGLNKKITPPDRIFGNAFDEKYNLPILPNNTETARTQFEANSNIKDMLLLGAKRKAGE